MPNGNPKLFDGRPTAQLVLFAFLIFNLLAIAAWDAWQLYMGRPQATVTDVVIAWSRQFPLVAFLIGFLVCHLLGLGAGRIGG